MKDTAFGSYHNAVIIPYIPKKTSGSVLYEGSLGIPKKTLRLVCKRDPQHVNPTLSSRIWSSFSHAFQLMGQLLHRQSWLVRSTLLDKDASSGTHKRCPDQPRLPCRIVCGSHQPLGLSLQTCRIEWQSCKDA